MRINSKETYQVGNMPIKDSTKAVSIRIEAAHAGIVNGNYIFYTPKALEQGSKSLKEFFKPLQKQHYDKTLGYIYDAVFESKSKSSYLDRINSASSSTDLVSAVKDYYRSEEYKRNTEGFGVLISKAKLYNQSKIKNLLRKDKGHVSIAGDSDGALCSICSGIITECDHTLGSRYDGEVCFAIADNLELDHISFEEIPANWKTNTLIITDSQLLGKIELIEGQPMKLTLDELKQRLENIEDVLTELGLSDYLTDYTATLETASATDFLFPKEKLVPLNSKLAVIVATKLLDLLDETDDKATVASIVEKEYKVLLGETSLEDAVTALAVVEETAEEVPEVKEETSTEETKEEVEAPEGTAPTLEVTDADQIALKIVDSLKDIIAASQAELESKLQEAISTKDRETSNRLWEDRYEAAQAELKVSKEAEKQLEDELKSSLLTQILLLKKVDVESDYYQKLQSRTLNELKMTLEDHQATAGSVTFEEKVETKEETLTITDSQTEKTIETDSVPGAEAIDTMSDSEDDTATKTSLEVQDADTVVNKILADIGTKNLDRNEYSALYKTTAMQHGIATAKQLHTVLKQNFKI